MGLNKSVGRTSLIYLSSTNPYCYSIPITFQNKYKKKMVNIQDLPNEILLDICEELEHIYITTKVENKSRNRSKKLLLGLPEFRLVSRQMNEIGTYVLFQQVFFRPDHKSWKDLTSIAADPNLSRAVQCLLLGNVAHENNNNNNNNEDENEHEDGKFDFDLSLFPNLVQVATNHWSVFRKQNAAPRKQQHCILQTLRANKTLGTWDYNLSHLQFLHLITAHHDFRISWLHLSLLLDRPFTQAYGKVLQTDNVLVQLRCIEIAYGMSIEPVQRPKEAWDADFPAIFAAAMRELPHLESITLDHHWWAWYWRPIKLIDLLYDHNWPNLRSCILKMPFATCSQIKRFLQPHVCKLEYLRIEGFPQNDGMNEFCNREEARIFRLWLEFEFVAEVWEFVDMGGEPAGLEQQEAIQIMVGLDSKEPPPSPLPSSPSLVTAISK